LREILCAGLIDFQCCKVASKLFLLPRAIIYQPNGKSPAIRVSNQLAATRFPAAQFKTLMYEGSAIWVEKRPKVDEAPKNGGESLQPFAPALFCMAATGGFP
jgi:hypothetical protein